MDLYRSKEWKQFRSEALRLGDEQCVRCSSSREGGAILHVHHKFYRAGCKPWEYSHEDCELLCQSCHAQEHGIIPPKTDWDLVGYDDLGAPDGHCDYCGTQIRHVFMIQHEKWPTLEVGEMCCDNLTTTNYATEYMKERRRYLDRQKRFASRWKGDDKGFHIQQNGIRVQIVSATDGYKLRMNEKIGKLNFNSVLDAKIKAFELIDSGKAADYFRRLEAGGL